VSRDRALAAFAIGLAALAVFSPPAAAATVRTDRSCYTVGQPVTVTGTGFTASSLYDIDIDGVDFGQSQTTATGGFSASLTPGGLGAGELQTVDTLDASDGTNEVTTTFTVTRPAGALFAGGGGLRTRAAFRVWDFAPDGPPATVYVHYIRAHHPVSETVALGRTSGQCGTLRSAARTLFPFAPARGSWTLQFDTSHTYSPHPSGPVADLRYRIG
jgi:hypothetical protein